MDIGVKGFVSLHELRNGRSMNTPGLIILIQILLVGT